MKTNKLKTLLLLMGLFISISMSAFEVDGIAYNITSSTDMTVEVISKSDKYSGDVVIPETITYIDKKYTVTSIGNSAFSGCVGLISVTIPNSVTSIDFQAFMSCGGLTSITIPNSVIIIGENAFRNCSGLTSVTIGKSVTSIGNAAFYGCSGLTSITIPNSVTSISHWAFCGCSSLTSVSILGSVTSIGYSAFQGCSGLTSINIPSSVTSIDGQAFAECSGLTSITIPNSVTAIGDAAFWECSGLTSITIPNSVISIGDHAFRDCSGLTSITIPNNVPSIRDWTFYGCRSLTSITIPSSVISIGERAFYGCSGLTSITIPNNVTSIGSDAFYGCSGLKNVNISNLSSWCKISFDNECSNPCYIAHCLYLNGKELTDLTIPNDITVIKNYAFYDCYNITSLSLPNKLETIGESAFYNCYQIEDLIIPNSVTSLGAKAFQSRSNFSRLKSVYIGENVVYIKENLFNGCYKINKVTSGIKEPMNMVSSVFVNEVYTNAELIVPEGCLSKYQACDGWKNFVNMKDTGGGIPYKDKLSVSNITGFTGKQVVFPIDLTNENDIAGVQFNLTLPAGVSVALNSKNKLMFSKTERDADHTLSGSKTGDGTYTVLLYSADTEAITGNEGSIIDMTLDIDKEMKDGTYEIKISDIVLSTTKAQKINADDVTAQLEVKSYLLGDPNNDGSIDVVDITMIANHILGNNPENVIFAAADVDADGTVDVNDIISIANIILYGSSSNAKPSMAKVSNYLANNVTSNESNGDGFTVKNVSVKKGGTVTVDFELTNAAHDFSGIQLDINLGDGLSFATKSNGKVNVTRGARLEDEDFTLSVAKQEGNQYRALGYYTDGSVIPEKSGTLFTLTLQADESLADGKTFNCQLDNITLSTKNNEKIQQETQTFTVTIGDATGISNLLNEDGTPAVMYDLTGKRIETPAKSGQVIIVKKGGKVVKVFKK